MKHGFIKTAAVTPKIKVADTVYNAEVICKKMQDFIKLMQVNLLKLQRHH